MSIETADYLEAAIHLPTGGKLSLCDVSWQEYEQLLDRLGDSSRLRVSYSGGRLEIMSPSNKHEKLKNLISGLVNTLCYELGMDWLSLGSVTLKTQPLGNGVEADDCFYFTKAKTIIRQDRLDLTSDPPPDLVIEIDLTSESSTKLDIYASFAIPEVWRYVKDHLEILELTGQGYERITASRFFPMLIDERVTEFIAECESTGQLHAQRNLRAWIAQLNTPDA